MTRTVMIRGPLTDDEVSAIVGLLARIEAARPTETFEIAIDDPETDHDLESFMAQLNPLRPGYRRVTVQTNRSEQS